MKRDHTHTPFPFSNSICIFLNVSLRHVFFLRTHLCVYGDGPSTGASSKSHNFPPPSTFQLPTAPQGGVRQGAHTHPCHNPVGLILCGLEQVTTAAVSLCNQKTAFQAIPQLYALPASLPQSSLRLGGGGGEGAREGESWGL